MGLSTHVLDLVTGLPVAGLQVQAVLSGQTPHRYVTNSDGRCTDLTNGTPLPPGTHTLYFEVGAYFAAKGIETFYDVVPIGFVITDTDRHYHVPLLLSPFGYSTYRGS